MDKVIAVNDRRRDQARTVRHLSIEDFHQQLIQHNIYRAFILFENGQFQLSHPKIMHNIRAFLELSQDFSNHEGIFIGREKGLDSLFWAFVHDTRRGLAQGGLRFHHYQSLADVLVDGLRLSQGMTRKNALAGLKWGGGKGIMTLPERFSHPSQFAQGPDRQRYFEAYGRFVASLGGIYYTAEDVGTNTPDMASIQSQNRFTTCIPESHGGSGNPSSFTARGVLRAMQAAWQSLTGQEQLYGVKIAVQGTGNVGSPLIRYLDDLGAEIWVSDINQNALEVLKKERPRLHIIDQPDAIFDLDVDIFAPCAIGAVVNVETIPRLKVRLICGAANNILKEPESDAELLHKKGIGMVPDFVCNRMGIVNCADEWQGYLAEDVRLAAEQVFPDTLRIFKYARTRNTTSTQAAIDLADMAASELHPMLGHRGRRIMDHLVHSRWQQFTPETAFRDTTPRLEPAFIPALDEPRLLVKWEQAGRFQADAQYSLAATPISTASNPDLGSTLSALLLDIKARALQAYQGDKPQRILGSEHGGLALQIAVEQALPHEREEIGRSEFVSLCRDYYNKHDAETRKQIHQLGIGFDPRKWISPMEGSARKAIERAYNFLKRAHLLYTLEAIAYHCPRCESIRVASDVIRQHRPQLDCYQIDLLRHQDKTLSVKLLYPEFLPGAVALAIHPDSSWASLAGETFVHPLTGQNIPIVVTHLAEGDAELICPLIHKHHEKIAQEFLLSERIQIFDTQGKICVTDFNGLSREEARIAILNRLGAKHWQKIEGEWLVETPLCGRCEAIVLPRYGNQLFVKIDEAVLDLRKKIESDEITFSHPMWKQKMLGILSELKLWCISRQYLWGNELPDHPQEVLSTWFTMAIWSLHGAGWPDNPKPAPIDEVFVDAELLFRWIITSQLAALILTGQPIFKHIHVHGTLHVMERSLKQRENHSLHALDEERFLLHMVRRPMRYRLGNVREPITLIRRYGADALRLGYVLALETHAPDVILLSEDRLRLARRSLNRLVTKITGLFNLVRREEQAGPPRLLDHWMLYDLQHIQHDMECHYLANDFAAVGQTLVQICENIVQYINTVIVIRRQQPDFGAVRTTLLALLEQMQRIFSPICPFTFESLQSWMALRVGPDETMANANHSACHVIEDSLEEPESVEPFAESFQAEVPELMRFFGSEWVLDNSVIAQNSEKFIGS